METDSLRTELKDSGTQKQGRYKKRETVYIFKCLDCPKEISVRKHDFNRQSGRCRKCADKNAGKKHSLLKRKEPFLALYNKFIYDRKRFNQFCSITYENFVAFTKITRCFYCQEEVFWTEYGLNKYGSKYNLDRVDSAEGYYLNNVVVCCWSCNEMKSNKFSHEEFIKIGKVLRKIKLARLKGVAF